jgi:hypothetical protein
MIRNSKEIVDGAFGMRVVAKGSYVETFERKVDVGINLFLVGVSPTGSTNKAAYVAVLLTLEIDEEHVRKLCRHERQQLFGGVCRLVLTVRALPTLGFIEHLFLEIVS